MNSWKALNTRAQANTKRIQEMVPETMREYKKLQNSAYAEGALDKKTKEIVALTYAIADKCEGCIGNHINKLVALGATRQEIAEVAEVAIVMGGGPGMVYGGKALEAFDEATAEGK
ncbi:carboxymuconolactone decarboxylase family protein [Lacicoccus alkaliphilus]|uniref:Alkylhydroperoxidase AhpD family core domain-containing protein n=1 Tax=Lacicoccus alkaliphilus DSM 16010 TaxID=1123231 RepID=A0A1M7IFX8_9BACL|nr:carboxymuconolactone decarboxylase family protein [Salinicoccus alkaliphilus]SHM39498.1 alkylhydroperoxidase AhpD family core domain-containing protein [Salinicoccus alkaliphilus DSM 16010]